RSPEQAERRWDDVKETSDIYNLGAILYHILSGRRPPDALEKIDAEKAFGKSRSRTIPPPLKRICLTAMQREPADRYASVSDLAADVRHWLDDERVTVYPESLPVRLARWARHHKPFVSGAAGLLVMAVVALTVGIVLINQEKDRTTEAYGKL